MSRKEKHSIFNKAVHAQQKRMNARVAGMAIAVVIVLVLGGVVFLDIIHKAAGGSVVISLEVFYAH